jgi:broad specificity phosphatase PhoE
VLHLSASHIDRSCNDTHGDHHADNQQRRRIIGVAISLLNSLYVLGGGSAPSAQARGLVQFPLKEPLLNTYHLLRAGTSLLDERDIYSTNPLFLTNRDDALSPSGQEQIVNACQLLKSPSNHLLPTVVRFSLAACCVDTANVVARELKLGRDRVVAEYTYLDPRAVGKWDMLSRAVAEPAVWALDNDTAGPDGTAGRPPPNEDGTPHETLSDAAVRLRQLMSVLETLYSGDTILLIFPDGTGPALLSCLMAGIPLNCVHELEFTSGELRINVTPESTRELWATRRDSAEYQETIAKGRVALKQLQSTSPDTIVSKMDQQIEAERIELEREYQEKKTAQRLRNEEQERQRAARSSKLAAEKELLAAASSRSGPDPVLVGLVGAIGVGGAAIAVAPATHPSGTANEKKIEGRGDLEALPVAGLYANPVEVRRVNGDRNSTYVTEQVSSRPLPIDAGTLKAATSPPPPALSPLEAADLAMDKYMNRDDGAQDWLQSLADILEEPEDESEGDSYP